MKSSIKIDLGPSIKVQVISTDDVRDKLMKQFFEELGYSSNLLYVQYDGHSGTTDGFTVKDITLYPIADGGEGSSERFTEEAYFRRSEVCIGQCKRLIPLCFSQIPYNDREELLKELKQQHYLIGDSGAAINTNSLIEQDGTNS